MAENFTDQLVDASIIRSLLLQRVSNGMSKEVAQIYTAMINDIEKALRASDPIGIKNMNKIIRELKDRFIVDLPVYVPLQDLAIDEAKYITKTVNTLAGVEVFNRVVPESTLMRIVNTSLMSAGEDSAATIPNWYKSVDASNFVDFERAVHAGVSAGDTNIQISKRVNTILNKNTKDAVRITTTAVAQVTNEARMAVYRENEDVIKGYEHVSVLDARTTKNICAPRDSALWSPKGYPLNEVAKGFKMKTPPLHMSCRSVLAPVIKSFEELGIPIKEVPVGKRASLTGQQSADLNFNSWLKRQDKDFVEDYLGKARADLYLEKKLTLKDLLAQNGKELTVKQLRARYD